MPLYLPDVPPMLMWASFAAFVCALTLIYATWTQSRVCRQIAIVCLLLFSGAIVNALYAQDLYHPCDALERGSWVWWISGCFLR